MAIAWFRFYEELNDFLPPWRRKVEFRHRFVGRIAIKDMIEALGVPHPEIDLILVNGVSVDFAYLVGDGDRISVYPMFEAFDIGPLQRLRPEPLRVTRFVVDANLGKLARYLRLLGFDTRYRNDFDDPELAEISAKEHRILLTRDRDLLKRSLVTHGYYVRACQPDRQVQEVLERFDLHCSVRPFQRCTACNGELTEVPKESVEERLEPKTRHYHDRFWHCGGCDRIYWRGGHYRRMRHWVQSLQTELRFPPAG